MLNTDATTQLPTISITGATGFIGAHLVRHFAQLDYPIEAVGRQKNPPLGLFQYADYRQADITKKMPPLAGDIIIHTAALASDSANWQDLFQTNVAGTRHVYEAATAARLFIHISSASVYPFQPTALIETAANKKQISSLYGKSKYISEQMLKAYRQEKNIAILRPRAVYGTGDRVLLPRILNLVRGQKIVAPGNLNIQVSMTHISNLIAAIEAVIAERELGSFQLWNVTDERVYNLREVVENLLRGIYKKELCYQRLPVTPLRYLAKTLQYLGLANNFTPQSLDYVTRSTVLSIEKIQKDLAYTAATDFYQALPALLTWVDSVGIERVTQADRRLPWLAC